MCGGGVSLCIPGCPRVCHVDQNGPKLTEILLGAGIKGAFHHTQPTPLFFNLGFTKDFDIIKAYMGAESCIRMQILIRESHEQREKRWEWEELTSVALPFCPCSPDQSPSSLSLC